MKTDLAPGTVIDDFVVEERIGQGGMALVYRARQLSINRDVALKVINIDQENDSDRRFRERFANEAALIAALEHLHILPVHAYGIAGNYAYLALRLLRGGSLKDLLWSEQPLPLEQAVRLFDQVAKGLAHAHSRGVIHRDLKPANILLDENQNAYLTDFGLAKLVDSDQHLTRTDNVVGTLAYMSPEHLRGDKLDQRADIYSMGVVLYHMLTGRVPFRAAHDEDMVAVIYKHLEEDPLPPRQYNPDLPPALEAVILRALAKDPAERFQSMGELALAVRAASGITLTASTGDYPGVAAALQTRSNSGTPRRRPRPRRRPAPALLLAVGLLLVALLLSVLLATGANRQSEAIAQTATLVALVATDTAGTATAAAITPTALLQPRFDVLENTTDRAENLAPAAEQIALAQRVLGAEGFIAIMPCNMTSEYHATFTREMTDFAREYGLRFAIYDSDSDGLTQRLQLEKALLDNASAFILCPLDVSLLDETLAAIQDRGLPLASTSGSEKKYGGVVTGVVDYEMGLSAGRTGGEVIRDRLPAAPRVILLDYPDLPNLIQRANGLEDGFLHSVPGAIILGRYQGATRQFAYESVAALLAAGTTFEVILSINDDGSYGAIDALVEAGIDPQAVSIISIDAQEQAQEFIAEDYFIRASLQVARTATARALVEVVVQMLAGGRVAEQIIIPPGEVVTAATLRLTPAPGG